MSADLAEAPDIKINSHRRLLMRVRDQMDFIREYTGCWCRRQSDVYPKAPGSSHTTDCLDTQQLYRDIEEALRETATV